MFARVVPILLVVLSGLFSASGCGPATATVSGEVTVDGKPLDRGLIVFSPADSNGEPARARIQNGKYEVRMVAGKKFVQLSAPVVIDRKKESDAPDARLVEITEESLPERYTTGTALSFDAMPGQTVKNWAVESKGK
jgi:hypothetical protein